MVVISIPYTDEEAEDQILHLAKNVCNKLRKESGAKIPEECIGFVIRCLRIKDYDVDKATKLVKNFSKSTTVLADLIPKFQPKLYSELFITGVITVLNSRDQFGRQVIISRVGKWNPKRFDFDDVVCAAMLLFNWTVGQSQMTQRKGVVFVCNLSGFGLQHLQAVKPRRVIQLVKLLQNAAPGRIKGVHVIFHPKIFHIIYQIVKPLLQEKLAKRVYFHGDCVASLHTYMDAKYLPEDFGGFGKETHCVDDNLIQNLIQDEQFHQELITYGIPTS